MIGVPGTFSSWSARPTGSRGQWIEGYLPGVEICRPMVLDLFRMNNGVPERAAANELRATFLPTIVCPAGTVLLDAPPVKPPLETGQWATSLRLGGEPGRCELIAMIEENQGDGTWQGVLTTGTSAPVWAVRMELQEELPKIIVGLEKTPVETTQFQYIISPEDYFPERTAIVFSVDGQVTGVAEIDRRGNGILSIEPGSIELDLEECTVKGFLNSRVVWGRGTANPVDLKVEFEQRELEVETATVHIAMDGNRDDIIEFGESEDRQYLFWVNDDNDVMHHNEGIYQEDDVEGPPNCDDDVIGGYHYLEPDPIDDPFYQPDRCKRDLEDFTRLQFQADENAAGLSGLVYSLIFKSSSVGNPSANVFAAVNCSMAYLDSTVPANEQIEKERLVTVDEDRESVIDSQYISSNSPRSCFILEGQSAGLGNLTLVVKKNGIVLSEESVELDLRPIDEFYEKHVVHLSSAGEVEPRSISSGIPSYVPENDEYVLFVHGYNLPEWTSDRWAETMFKRLWWLGYKGHMGAFRWPEQEGLFAYNASEFNAWGSARALRYLLPDLDARFPGQIRILAHSQGNVVTSEALRLLSTPISLRYIAAQPAVSGHMFDSRINPYTPVRRNPNIYAHFFSGTPDDQPYFSTIQNDSFRMFRYYNEKDYALNLWKINNYWSKPSSFYYYVDNDGNIEGYDPAGGDRFIEGYRDPDGDLIVGRELTFPGDRYRIFSYAAHSISAALGAFDVLVDGFEGGSNGLVSGFEGELNLQVLGFNDHHYSHSKEFRSNIVDEREFWRRVAENFEISINPQGE